MMGDVMMEEGGWKMEDGTIGEGMMGEGGWKREDGRGKRERWGGPPLCGSP